MTSVAEIIVETLERAGVKRCYGIVGDTLNHVTDAISRSSIRWVHMRHEEAGGMAAGADAMLTGELAACAGSVGPGSLHFINGLYESHRNRAPVVLIASQHVRDEIGFDFPQEVDYKAVYAPCSVFCEEIRTAGQARRMTVAAAQAALSKRGVAVLIVPADLAEEKLHQKVPEFAVHTARPVVTPAADELRQIADALNSGKRISIYGGSGCAGAQDRIRELAGKLKAPVARTSRAKDWLEPDNPFDVGMTGFFGIESGYEALMRCDTLLLLGCDFAWRQFYPDKATIIQIDIDGAHLGKRHPVDIAAIGDIGPTLEALLPLLEDRTDSAFLDSMLEMHASARAKQEDHAHRAAKPIHPQFMVETISRHAADDAVWTADGGSATVWCLRHVPATGKNRSMISLTHGTMANAMPQALGAQAAFPGRQVISLSGDGGLAMLMGDMLTATQENLPIKVALINNGTLGFVELEMKIEGLVDHYTDLQNPDFGAVASAMGWWGRRVEDPGDLNAAVVEWLAAPGPALLDVVTDRYELVMPPHVEPAKIFGTALYSAKAVLSGRAGDVAKLTKNLID